MPLLRTRTCRPLDRSVTPAARAWAAIAREEPEKRELCEILSRYMGAYADADKAAEKELRDLAARQAATQGENA